MNGGFSVDDNYMTPKYVWEQIKQYIPDKIIWEPFYGDGKSGQYLTELGFNVIHENEDFFKNDKGEIVVSNPPFSKSKEVLTKMKGLNKPFILLMPTPKIATQYFRELFKDEKIQLIIPPKRIHFIQKGNIKNGCNFDCFYYCWKMNLSKDIIFL